MKRRLPIVLGALLGVVVSIVVMQMSVLPAWMAHPEFLQNLAAECVSGQHRQCGV